MSEGGRAHDCLLTAAELVLECLGSIDACTRQTAKCPLGGYGLKAGVFSQK